MKNNIKISIIVSIVVLFAACKGGGNNSSNDIKSLEAFYKSLHSDNDISSATFVARQILSLDSTKYYLLDSLALHYAALNNLKATEKYTNLALAHNPNNKKLLEIKGQIALSNNDTKSALESYQDAYNLNNDDKLLMAMNTIHLENKDYIKSDSLTKKITSGKYLVQVIQDLFNYKQPKRANVLLDRVLNEFKGSKETYPLATSQKGDIQEVNIIAVAYFIKAQIAGQKNDIKGYSALLNKALKIQPDFFLAGMAKKELAQMMRQRR